MMQTFPFLCMSVQTTPQNNTHGRTKSPTAPMSPPPQLPPVSAWTHTHSRTGRFLYKEDEGTERTPMRGETLTLTNPLHSD